jgi:hypothetical protein
MGQLASKSKGGPGRGRRGSTDIQPPDHLRRNSNSGSIKEGGKKKKPRSMSSKDLFNRKAKPDDSSRLRRAESDTGGLFSKSSSDLGNLGSHNRTNSWSASRGSTGSSFGGSFKNSFKKAKGSKAAEGSTSPTTTNARGLTLRARSSPSNTPLTSPANKSLETGKKQGSLSAPSSTATSPTSRGEGPSPSRKKFNFSQKIQAPDTRNMSKYQKAQALMYAIASHQEVLTALKCVEAQEDAINRAETNPDFAQRNGGLPKMRKKLESEHNKKARYEAKRDRTGFAHEVMYLSYEKLTAKLLTTQRTMALLEKQGENC